MALCKFCCIGTAFLYIGLNASIPAQDMPPVLSLQFNLTFNLLFYLFHYFTDGVAAVSDAAICRSVCHMPIGKNSAF